MHTCAIWHGLLFQSHVAKDITSHMPPLLQQHAGSQDLRVDCC
jgi:hypothetical protein